MKIILRPFGTLQRYFGGSRIEMVCPAGTTFFQLCDAIDERWGKHLPPSLWNSASRWFAAQVIVMIGGKELVDHRDLADHIDLAAPQDLAAQEDPVLCEGQEILLLLPFAGG